MLIELPLEESNRDEIMFWKIFINPILIYPVFFLERSVKAW